MSNRNQLHTPVADRTLLGTIMAFLPMLLLVVGFQRYLVRGLFGGSVKG